MFDELPRKEPSPISCIKCGTAVGTVQLPSIAKAPMTLRAALKALSVALDADITEQLFTPRAFAETGALLCPKCTNG